MRLLQIKLILLNNNDLKLQQNEEMKKNYLYKLLKKKRGNGKKLQKAKEKL